jgi:Zn-dependent protease
MVFLPLFTAVTSGWPIGFASAPYDPVWAMNHPRRAAWMSLAGPAANLLLVLVASAAIHMGIAAGIFTQPDAVNGSAVVAATHDGVASAGAFLVSAFFTLNLILFLFNLMPLPPLDGSGAIGLLLPESWTLRLQGAMRHPVLAIGGILIAWTAFGPIFRRAFWFAISLLYPGADYSG